ncbi:MAG TPA: hypothetical protein VFX23_00435, partial [Limnobacter sp.]|uniref:hypothetical protein n=1 Tax=Limnobacter sp. TaxID=2003368 RepID=UPI002E2FD58E
MNLTIKGHLNKIKNRPTLTTLVLLALMFWLWKLIQPTPVIKLYIGEPWEEMRKKSTAEINAAIEEGSYDNAPKLASALEFNDS